MGRSKGGLTNKIHAVVDANGRPFKFDLTLGQTNDCKPAVDLLTVLDAGTVLLADKAHDTEPILGPLRRRLDEPCEKRMPELFSCLGTDHHAYMAAGWSNDFGPRQASG